MSTDASAIVAPAKPVMDIPVSVARLHPMNPWRAPLVATETRHG